MRAESLVPLVDPEEDEASTRYAQGTVVSWDRTTGRNRVAVGGTELQDLPVLNTAETISLKVGHVVGLLRWKSQWFILGRLVIPGGPDFASSSLAFDSGWKYQKGYSLGTSDAVIATATVPVPKWASRAMVIANLTMSVNNSGGALDNLYPSVQLATDLAEGFKSGSYKTAAVSTYWVNAAVGLSDTMDVAGASQVIARAVAGSGTNPWPANADNSVLINMSVMFRSGS